MNQTSTLQVKIYAPFKVYFNGPAESLSATNETGPFDILLGHKNFMSLLKPGEVTVRQKQSENYNLTVERGVMHVRDNKITVFLDV